MNRMGLGRLILTGILLMQSVLGFALDWSGNHLLNPLWHPHARFHGALLLFLLTGVSSMGIWLLWRQSKEPGIAIVVAAVISLSFWTPFFYITFLLPSATLWAGDPAQGSASRRLRLLSQRRCGRFVSGAHRRGLLGLRWRPFRFQRDVAALTSRMFVRLLL